MKIAIVTPHPIPFALGGAENLWWGLQDHFEHHTPHRCDIISLLSPEGSFWDLVASYESFSKLDLSAYDCVISGKYPAWMVRHPNHVCYMLHRLRGLYDTYAPGAHDSAVLDMPRIRSLLAWMAEAGGTEADESTVPELFERLNSLRQADLPEHAFAFPGPVSRAVVHFLDGIALSPSRIRRYATIADTVRRRKGYFPPQVAVDVLYPPPHRVDYRTGVGRYLFTSSRLDRPKRLDLVIEAMKRVSNDIPLLIAGTGPDEARLKTLAGDDSRIRFLGFVADDTMPALYADALAVVFAPYDEDYGLITIEAMKSGKPVLTVDDSGGPCEFVRNGETGFVSAPTAEALADRIAYMVAHPDEAHRMGEAARNAVEAVNWHRVADGLLEETPALPAPTTVRRPKLTVATTFRVFPPMNGGQARVYHLYKNLAESFDIDIVSLRSGSEGVIEKEIAPGLTEISVPKSAPHEARERELSRQAGDLPIGDIAAHALIALTPAYGEMLELSAISSDAVVACHPYLGEALRRAAPGKRFWYEAQDVEATLKSALLSPVPGAAPLLGVVRQAEQAAWRNADRVFACARRDLDELQALYGGTRARLHEVPNGVALDEIPYTPLTERRRLQNRSGLASRLTAIFMGSWHGPNLEAIEAILENAPHAPEARFLVIGSASQPFKNRVLPGNVHLLGQVDDRIRNDLLAAADVALNPMFSGSGTNLKMLDYFAAGIPVISTGFGARGLLAEAGSHYVRVTERDVAGALRHLSSINENSIADMTEAARQLTEEFYSWHGIAQRFLSELKPG